MAPHPRPAARSPRCHCRVGQQESEAPANSTLAGAPSCRVSQGGWEGRDTEEYVGTHKRGASRPGRGAERKKTCREKPRRSGVKSGIDELRGSYGARPGPPTRISPAGSAPVRKKNRSTKARARVRASQATG